jgi:16S rRNA (uracil1498-N3)-methyltransferase
MQRFFVPPSWIEDNHVTLTGPQAHQIAHVLRMRPGDLIMVLDNSGWEIETQLVSVERHAVRGEVLRRGLAGGEPRTKISLYQGVLRGKNFELVLQKGTEVGIVEFVPVITERCLISDLNAVEKKRPRWEMILQEAAEQCRRGRKPVLRSTMLFPKACERVRQRRGLALVPWEEEGHLNLRDMLRNEPAGHTGGWPPMSVDLFVGPEGGFAPDEVDLAQRYGIVPVTLGPRILRAETAGLVSAAAILYELGDLE